MKDISACINCHIFLLLQLDITLIVAFVCFLRELGTPVPAKMDDCLEKLFFWENILQISPEIHDQNSSNQSKAGDAAEEKFAKMLNNKDLCKMLGEPLYIIRGQSFAQRERDSLESNTGWTIGELDIIVVSIIPF